MICKYKKLILSLFLSAAIPFGAALPVSAGIEALSGQINSGEVSKAFVPPENGPVVGRVTARYMLNVRKSPWGEIIDGFYPGVKVDIFGFEGEWYQIRYGGGVAYVHTSLITIESGNPRSPAADVEFPVKG
ncbi:MAG TPA: SH3 domain-containing protein, partial [Candidatus Wallbacteria bacterium]|nr:SH3 domain-containing protein [Candidatus Wallbacteria bacterium]